ncbi:MAG: hypothetical protein K0S32_1375 [Bacteroidetes bacterium]|jgi:hypothetical protein|nr:hypothetical protein [Bacteroidota bacterium]
MEKFIYLFRGGQADAASQSAETMQADMQKWMTWMDGLGKNGNLAGGEPLQQTGKQVNGTKKVVTDGPFIEAKEAVGGYLIINAKNMDEAVEIAKGCPVLESNGKVEIRPIQKMDM